MADLATLAQAHMRQQVREVAQIQALLGRLWDREMSSADIDGSFSRFQSQASAVIKAGRSRGELTAQQYYEATRILAGYEGLPPAVAEQPPNERANRAALHATSVANAKAAIAKGTPPEKALDAAKVAMLRAAKRRILEAPRKRLIALSVNDPNAGGWARVGDGKPCHFCAMLIGRGPVYSAGTAAFDAHDGCGCSVKPVFKNDPTRGWTPDSQRAADVYAVTPAYGDFREVWPIAQAHPDLSVEELAPLIDARRAEIRAFHAARKGTAA